MNRQEAAEVLEELKKPGRFTILAPICVLDAIRIAIDALGSDNNVGSEGDLISRKAAIDAVMREARSVDGRYLESERIIHESDAVEALSMLPSAQPERRIGKWIIRALDRTEWYRVECSECGEDVTATIPLIGSFPFYKALWDYCPECGADMRGKQDE